MSKEAAAPDYVELYQNIIQVLVNIVDPNKLFVVAGRALGKTSQITARRILRVADEMPREVSIISHKSFVALFTNVIPTVLETFRSEVTMPDGSTRPQLIEGLDYVVGEKDLPKHFQSPRYPLLYPERSIVFADGHVLQAVSIDRADSIAGRSVVHAFLEEMKYSDGEKVRTRIIPAIRTSRIGMGSEAHKSHLHGGITGVTDMGRVSLGEFNWYQDYEKETDPQLIADIVTLSLEINKAQYNVYMGHNVAAAQNKIRKYLPLLRRLQKGATLYVRASTFANRDVLGLEYFKTQREILSMSEFLSSICSIGDRNRDNLFFDLWDEQKHTYDDSYKYSGGRPGGPRRQHTPDPEGVLCLSSGGCRRPGRPDKRLLRRCREAPADRPVLRPGWQQKEQTVRERRGDRRQASEERAGELRLAGAAHEPGPGHHLPLAALPTVAPAAGRERAQRPPDPHRLQ